MQYSEDIKLPDYLFIAYNNAIAIYPEDSALAKDAFLKSIKSPNIVEAITLLKKVDAEGVEMLLIMKKLREQAEVADNLLKTTVENLKKAIEEKNKAEKTLNEVLKVMPDPLEDLPYESGIPPHHASLPKSTGNIQKAYEALQKAQTNEAQVKSIAKKTKDEFIKAKDEFIKARNNALKAKEIIDVAKKTKNNAQNSDIIFNTLYGFYNGQQANKIDGQYPINHINQIFSQTIKTMPEYDSSYNTIEGRDKDFIETFVELVNNFANKSQAQGLGK